MQQPLQQSAPAGWTARAITADRFAWIYHSKPTHQILQGWKIHVSCSGSGFVDCWRIVSAYCFANDLPFKLPADAQGIDILNSGEAGSLQIGKIFTLYTSSDDPPVRHLEELHRQLPAPTGPIVPSDLYLHARSAVSCRYGAGGDGPFLIDHLGMCVSGLVAPDGTWLPDIREPGHALPFWIVPDPKLSGFDPVDLAGEFSVDGTAFIPLRSIRRSRFKSVALYANSRSLDTVVVKAVRPNTVMDRLGNDFRARVRNEAEVLAELSKTGFPSPRPIALIDQIPCRLVMQDLGGTTLAALKRQDILDHFGAALSLVAELHRKEIVHGDIKLDNFAVADGELFLLDFELAGFRGDARILLGGTPLYARNERSDLLSFADDYRALAVAFSHALLSVDPAHLVQSEAGLEQLLLAHAIPAGVVQTILRCMNDDVADKCRTALSGLRDVRAAPVPSSPVSDSDRQAWRQQLRSVPDYVSNYAVALDKGAPLWRNAHLYSSHVLEAINLGASGIILGLLTLCELNESEALTATIRRAASALAEQDPIGTAPGLFTGDAGVALTLAVVAARFRDDKLRKAALKRWWSAAAHDRNVDLFSGSAGVILSALLLEQLLGEQTGVLSRCDEIAGSILLASVEDGDLLVWPSDPGLQMNGDPLLGAAHGSAGMALALRQIGCATGSDRYRAAGIGIVEALCARTLHTPGLLLPRSTNPRWGRAAQTHWCHGAAGLVWAALYDTRPSLSLPSLDGLIKALADQPALTNPTYCHGLAGLLEMWRMTKRLPSMASLASAQEQTTLRLLFAVRQQRDGATCWASEQPTTITPDLWVGTLGPAASAVMTLLGSDCALLEPAWLKVLCKPKNAGPPTT